MDENNIARFLLDDSDPTLLTYKEMKANWSTCTNFMEMNGLKPWDRNDVDSAKNISRELKRRGGLVEGGGV